VVPVLLFWYEMTIGTQNWRRVLPFLLPAAIYGGYGLAYNLHQKSLYTFQFGPTALGKSLVFYFSKLLWLPYAGFAFLLLPLAVRDRRIVFGAGALICGLTIYCILPGRLLEVYLYLAMTGAAVAVAVLVDRWPVAALVLLVWMGWQYTLIRKNAKLTLAAAEDRRAYVAAIRAAPDAPIYIYDRIPRSMHHWGVEGALQLYHPNVTLVHRLEDSGLPGEGAMQLLEWDASGRRLEATPFAPQAAVCVSPSQPAAAWQLLSGWRPRANGWLEMGAAASARLYSPAGEPEFECEACLETGARQTEVELRVFVDGQSVCKLRFEGEGCLQQRARVRQPRVGILGIDFLASRESALVIRSFGFCSQ